MDGGNARWQNRAAKHDVSKAIRVIGAKTLTVACPTLLVARRVVAVGNLGPVRQNADRLKDAIKAAKTARDPIELLVRNGDRYRTVRVDYHDGLRYPRFERVAGTPARLDDILAARK